MKKLIYAFIAMLGMTCSFTGCSEEEVPLYDGIKSGLFIQQVATWDIYGNPLSFRDSLDFSFAGYSDKYTSTTVSFYIRTMGEVVDYPRPYKVQVMEGTDAIEGEDFDIVKDNDFIIHPYQSEDTLRVRVYRTQKIRTKKIRIKIGLVPNEHFELPIEEYKASPSWSQDGNMHSATSYVVRVSEQYSKPSYYTFFGGDYFGEFTVTRFAALNNLMGWPSNWSGVKLGHFDYAARQFQKYLQELADKGTPLIDDDGVSFVQLPTKYAVDYSKYGQ